MYFTINVNFFHEVHVLVRCVGLWQMGKGILIWRLHIYSPNEENLATQFLKWKLFHVFLSPNDFTFKGIQVFSSIGVSMNIKTFSTQESLLVEAMNFCVLYLHLTCFTWNEMALHKFTLTYIDANENYTLAHEMHIYL
jgi:hypothetical protein